MDLTTITYSDFSALFFRDFPYLPVYNSSQTYFSGNEVYYGMNFWTCSVDGTQGVTPGNGVPQWTITQDNINNYVQNQDIQNAFNQAQILLNQALFGTVQQITLGYLYLSAHFLCLNLRAANAGLAGIGAMPVGARSVDGVSETYNIPEKLLRKSTYQTYLQTTYGMTYLAMIQPQLAGNFQAFPAQAYGGYGGTIWGG
jgi:hypothetical protein